jgi:hypothetical protein
MKSTYTFRTELKWAGIFILSLLGWMLAENIVGLHGSNIAYHQYCTMGYIVPAVWISVLALRDKRDRDYHGEMNYKQGLLSGIIISAFVTVCSPVSQWIITYIITPEFFPNVIAYSVQTGYYATIEEAEQYFNYSNYAIQSTVWSAVMGVITSVGTAFFVKTKQIH